MRSAPKSVKIPVALLDAIEILRQPGRPLADYPSVNAALVGLIRYAIAFPRPHDLTTGIARCLPDEQDAIDDLLVIVAREKIDLRTVLPKPASAADILAVARKLPDLRTNNGR